MVNDLSFALPQEPVIYADDTTLIVRNKNIQIAQQFGFKEFDIALQWSSPLFK